MKQNILFVCLGNICRSPTAEGIMNSLIREKGFGDNFFCDSAGTSGHHSGEPADSRMIRHASARGYELLSRSRKFVEKDFQKFDWILAMDNQNFDDILSVDKEGQFSNKVFRIVEFAEKSNYDEVPDPYYGGEQGFEAVINILEDCCQGLLKKLTAR